jgi:hypothetical protein
MIRSTSCGRGVALAMSYESLVTPKLLAAANNGSGACEVDVAEGSPRLRGSFTASLFWGGGSPKSVSNGLFDFVPPP